MLRKRFIGSIFSFLLLSGSVSGLAIGIHGCSSNTVEQQSLPQENAEILLKKYLSNRSGNLKTFRGIVQGNSTNEANAELEIENFSYNQGLKYTGPALASFTRYTNGQWVMKRFTLNPQNLFGAVWFDTDEKVPTSEEVNRINQDLFWSEEFSWAGGLTRKGLTSLVIAFGVMSIPILFYILQPKKKEN